VLDDRPLTDWTVRVAVTAGSLVAHRPVVLAIEV
jgi:hypothetical protein